MNAIFHLYAGPGPVCVDRGLVDHGSTSNALLFQCAPICKVHGVNFLATSSVGIVVPICTNWVNVEIPIRGAFFYTTWRSKSRECLSP